MNAQAPYKVRRSLALLLIGILLCGPWLAPPPVESAVVPFRFPQETVGGASFTGSSNDAVYTVSFSGGGIPLQTYRFLDPAARPICFEWSAWGDSVITTARAMQQGGRVLISGDSIPAGVPTDFAFQIAGGGIPMGWRTVTITPSPGTSMCLVTHGQAANVAWLTAAQQATTDLNLRAMLESAALYFGGTTRAFARLSPFAGVVYQRRPAMLVVISDGTRTRIDVLQEPLAFTDSAYENADQRWRLFRAVTGLLAGSAEEQALIAVTGRAATSAPTALLEAAGAHVPIVTLRRATDLAKITADAPTLQMMSDALAAKAVVITTAYPVTSAGWTGTPWIALNQGGRNLGTFLGTLRGAEGAAGANPDPARAEQLAAARTVTQMGLALTAYGLVLTIDAEGPTTGVMGLAMTALGVALTLYGYVVELTLGPVNGPKTGHVDIDVEPSTTPGSQTAAASGGPGPSAGGPAGSAPGGPAGSPSGTPGTPPGLSQELTIGVTPSNDGFGDSGDGGDGDGSGDGGSGDGGGV
jgi:hypothetical protein